MTNPYIHKFISSCGIEITLRKYRGNENIYIDCTDVNRTMFGICNGYLFMTEYRNVPVAGVDDV